MTWQASPCRTQSRCPQMKPHAADSRVGGLASAGCDTHSCSISQRDSHHRVQRSRRPGSCDTADIRVVVAGGGRGVDEGAQWAGEVRPGEVQLAQAAWGQKGGQLVVVEVDAGEARPGEVQLAQAAWGQKGGQLVVLGVLVGDAQLVAEARRGEVQLQQGQKRAVLVVLGVLVGDAGEAPPGEVQSAQGQKRAVLVVLGVLVGDAQLVAEARPGEVAQREKRALTGMQPQCLGEAACRFGRKNPLQHLGRPMVRR